MTGVQYYRRALVTPCALFLVAAIPGVFALRGFVAVGFVMVALAAAFGGADQADEGAKAVLLPLLLLVWASPAFVAYLLVMPIALRRIWRSPEEAYRKVSARLPLGVFAATFLIIVALTTHHLGWKSVILGVFVAVPGAVVAYAYWGVAGLVLTMLRSTSVVGEATGGGTPSSRGVAVAAVLGLGCGVAMLAAAAVGMSHVSSDREIVANAERGPRSRTLRRPCRGPSPRRPGPRIPSLPLDRTRRPRRKWARWWTSRARSSSSAAPRPVRRSGLPPACRSA